MKSSRLPPRFSVEEPGYEASLAPHAVNTGIDTTVRPYCSIYDTGDLRAKLHNYTTPVYSDNGSYFYVHKQTRLRRVKIE